MSEICTVHLACSIYEARKRILYECHYSHCSRVECARNLWIIFREAFPNQIGVLCYFLEEGIRARDETYAIHHRLFSAIH